MSAEFTEDIASEINEALSGMELMGEKPDTIVFTEGSFPLRVRVKGTSKQKKRARFINRKVGAELEALMAWYGLTPAAPSCAK